MLSKSLCSQFMHEQFRSPNCSGDLGYKFGQPCYLIPMTISKDRRGEKSTPRTTSTHSQAFSGNAIQGISRYNYSFYSTGSFKRHRLNGPAIFQPPRKRSNCHFRSAGRVHQNLTKCSKMQFKSSGRCHLYRPETLPDAICFHRK